MVVLGDCWIPSFFILVMIAAQRIDVLNFHLAFSGSCHMFPKTLSVQRVVTEEGRGDYF